LYALLGGGAAMLAVANLEILLHTWYRIRLRKVSRMLARYFLGYQKRGEALADRAMSCVNIRNSI
jgi:hypothetical protein